MDRSLGWCIARIGHGSPAVDPNGHTIPGAGEQQDEGCYDPRVHAAIQRGIDDLHKGEEAGDFWGYCCVGLLQLFQSCLPGALL